MGKSIFELPVTTPVAVFGTIMLIITVAPLLARRARLPGVVGIILVAALLGPGAAGVIERNDQVLLLGTIGLLYLIFSAGLSLDLNQFFKLKHRALAFGLLSFGFPLAAGTWLFGEFAGLGMAAALLVGSIVGTHTLLAYPVARSLGLTRGKAVIMTVGGTIITDALGLIILAIVVKSTHGALGPTFWFTFITTLVVYVTAVLWIVPRVGRWFFRTFPNEPTGEMAFALAVLFTVAIITDMVGLAPLIGAFLTGLALNRLIPSSGPLMSRILFLGDALFIPAFLVSVGLLVDFGALFRSLNVWIYLALLCVALYAGKYLAAMLCRLFFGHTNAEGMVIFGLSTPQAAGTLAITLVGYDQLQLFTIEMVNAVVLLILVSCIVGPMLVQHYGRDVSATLEKEGDGDKEAPQRILVPLANPATAEGLMNLALAIRSPLSQEPIYPLAVASRSQDVYTEVAKAEKLLVGAVNAGTAAGVPVTPVTRVDVNPVDGMLRAIQELRISTLIIGWNGQVSTRERIFGSVLDQLLARTSQLTMVCKLGPALNTTGKIYVVIPALADRSPGFAEALRTIKIVADKVRSDVVLVVPAEAQENVMAAARRIRPEVNITALPLRRWGLLLARLGRSVSDEDMLFLLSARERTPAWRPSLNRLPGLIAERLPNVAFITIYPAEADIEPDYLDISASTPGGSTTNLPRPVHRSSHPLLVRLTERHVQIREQAPSPAALLKAMLRQAFPGDRALDGTGTESLIRKLLDFELELAPGVLLLHAPMRNLSEPQVLLAFIRNGMEFKSSGTTGRLVILLLSPTDLPPDQHLANLSFLARLCSQSSLMERIETATSPGELIRRLAPPPEENEAGAG